MKKALSALLLMVIMALPASAMAGKARAAIVKEQGITFAVVHVNFSVIQNKAYANKVQALYESYFDVPVVLMADNDQRTKWHGRGDIVDFISDYSFAQLPWKMYNLPE